MSNKRMRYTEDFKKSIVALYHDGQTQLRLSEDYGVAPSTIHKWIKLFPNTHESSEGAYLHSDAQFLLGHSLGFPSYF